MKAYVFVVRKTFDNDVDYLFSLVRDTYEEAVKDAGYWFNKSCAVSEIKEVEI